MLASAGGTNYQYVGGKLRQYVTQFIKKKLEDELVANANTTIANIFVVGR